MSRGARTLLPPFRSQSPESREEQSPPPDVPRARALTALRVNIVSSEEGEMNWLRSRLIWAAVLVPLASVLAACEEGPAEDAGEAIDETAEEAGEAAEDAAD